MSGHTVEDLNLRLNLGLDASQMRNVASHLHANHDLEFRRVQGVRTYGLQEFRDALRDCRETCKTPLAELSPLRNRDGARLPAPVEDPASLKRTGTNKARVAGTRTARAHPANPAKTGPSERERIDQMCAQRGLEASRHIAERYGKTSYSGEPGNFMTKLKLHGLKPVDKDGRVLLYEPRQVDEICGRLGIRPVSQ
jgi:hypothetical protein